MSLDGDSSYVATWLLEPFISFGPLRLAASREEVEEVIGDTPREFFAFLSAQERRPDCCVIRGAPGGPWFPGDGKPVYRLLHPQAPHGSAPEAEAAPSQFTSS